MIGPRQFLLSLLAALWRVRCEALTLLGVSGSARSSPQKVRKSAVTPPTPPTLCDEIISAQGMFSNLTVPLQPLGTHCTPRCATPHTPV